MMIKQPESHHDPLSPELYRLSERINAEHAACEAALRCRVVHAIETGRLLLEAKTRLGRGHWSEWVRGHCHFPEREARGYVRIARLSREREAANPQRFADLGLRDALALLAESQALSSGGSPEGARLAELEAVLDGVGRRLIEVGRAVLEMKESLKSEQFAAWLAAEFPDDITVVERLAEVAEAPDSSPVLALAVLIEDLDSVGG